MNTTAAMFAILGLAAFVFTAGVAVRWRTALRATDDAWRDFSQTKNPDIDGLDEATFRRIYLRQVAPRGGLYAVGAGLSAIFATPILARIIEPAWALGWALSGRPDIFAPGQLIALFLQYFCFLASWAAIAYAFAWRFHARRPRSLETELRSARADAAIAQKPKTASMP